MSHPHLLFCPYLPFPPTVSPVKFADWELGPLQSFEDRWADLRFKHQATIFLSKFLGTDDEPIKNPALLCRNGKQLNGEQPSPEEVRALELSLAFASIDRNPRFFPENADEAWGCVTADNAEVYLWPIDLEQGHVTTNTGFIISVRTGGYNISDTKLVLRPPLDLHSPIGVASPDPLVLAGIYETVLGSLRSPGEDSVADRVRIALEWFVKAWSNTATLHFPERLVFLKTAFEALTGSSKSWKSAERLREIFEELKDTTERDSEILVWSPKEKPIWTQTWHDKEGCIQTKLITDLEHWFIEFSAVRNGIIHEGKLSLPTYSGPTTAYKGKFFFTAEFLLRGVIKVLLSKKPGYEDAWRSEIYRDAKAACADISP